MTRNASRLLEEALRLQPEDRARTTPSPTGIVWSRSTTVRNTIAMPIDHPSHLQRVTAARER